MTRTTGRLSFVSGYTTSVCTLRSPCLMPTHSEWRGDLAMRSRAQGCDHSCEAAICAPARKADRATAICRKRFMEAPLGGWAVQIVIGRERIGQADSWPVSGAGPGSKQIAANPALAEKE